jgi:hypothetical protein
MNSNSINATNAYANVLLALCVWREADDQTPEAQLGVMWSILNRAAVPEWWNGHKAFDIPAVILFPDQYDSFKPGDPDSTRFPKEGEELAIFQEILRMTISPGSDPTGGATNYFSGYVVPAWALKMEKTIDIDSMHFYKPIAQSPAVPA